MKSAHYHSSSAQQIGRRLFILVFRALASVLVALIVLLVLAAWAVLGWASSSPQNFEPSLVLMLETHYDARGNWDGADRVFERYAHEMVDRYQRYQNDLFDTTLLDAGGKIINSSNHPAEIGLAYTAAPGDQVTPLVVEGKQVGSLVFHSTQVLTPLTVFLPIIGPFSVFALLLGILALVIGLMLGQRVVGPLSEVIAAAQRIAEGNLSARVKAGGPSDLRALSDSFNLMAESLERNDRERREMLAIVAHELRTPLSVLRGRLEGIVDGIYPADGAHIAQALEETYLLGRLVDDLRLLTLAESRQLHFDLSEIDLAGLAARSVELFAAEAEENGIRLNLTIGEAIFPLKADPQRMEQAIGNLVGNALRYVPAGGVVDLTVRGEAGQQMILAVSDSGPGVPEADLPHIFDRFWRADSARSRHTGGSGLGLAIAKELIEAQGGQIRARNRVEGGLEVMISFSKS